MYYSMEVRKNNPRIMARANLLKRKHGRVACNQYLMSLSVKLNLLERSPSKQTPKFIKKYIVNKFLKNHFKIECAGVLRLKETKLLILEKNLRFSAMFQNCEKF